MMWVVVYFWFPIFKLDGVTVTFCGDMMSQSYLKAAGWGGGVVCQINLKRAVVSSRVVYD